MSIWTVIQGCIALGTISLLAGSGIAETTLPIQQHYPEANQAAQKAIDALRELKDKKDNAHATELGFESADEAAEAEGDFGRSLRLFRVSLSMLKDFQAGDDPNLLLEDLHRIIVPVVVKGKGQVRSSVTVAEDNKGWSARQRGSSQFIRGVQLIVESEPYRTSTLDIVVMIRALDLYFLANSKAKQLLLIPIANNLRFKFKAGEALPAQKVFLRLTKAAKKILEEERTLY